MNRRELVALVGAAAVTWPLAAPFGIQAQETGKVYRIGYLSYSSSAVTVHFIDAFRKELHELGWIEGQNVVIDSRFAEGRSDRLSDLAAELVRIKVDIILAATTPALVAAKNATGTVPIVAVNVGDLVALGLIASLARPGGNITGLSYSVGVDVFGKELELLKEALPDIGRVAVLSNPANPTHALAIPNVKVAARALGVELELLEGRDPNEFDGAFAVMAKERVKAILVLPDALFFLHRTRLADLAVKNRLPSMHGLRENVEAGGLMSYGPNSLDNYRRAATFVDKIFKGTMPADLPLEQPTKYELVINLKTAKSLGLMIPTTLLARADEVIE
jgi:putative ABC transport system substrate-binding protein